MEVLEKEKFKVSKPNISYRFFPLYLSVWLF